jgi:hypothetical protein
MTGTIQGNVTVEVSDGVEHTLFKTATAVISRMRRPVSGGHPFRLGIRHPGRNTASFGVARGWRYQSEGGGQQAGL